LQGQVLPLFGLDFSLFNDQGIVLTVRVQEQVILDLYSILFFLALDRDLDIVGLGIKVDDGLNGPFFLALETLGQGL